LIGDAEINMSPNKRSFATFLDAGALATTAALKASATAELFLTSADLIFLLTMILQWRQRQ
jgi:hypothetical protein